MLMQEIEVDGVVFAIVSNSFINVLSYSFFNRCANGCVNGEVRSGVRPLAMIKAYFEGEEFQTEDGKVDKVKIIDHVEDLLTYTEYGYRFIYEDTVQQVSFVDLS